jgi:methylmalonyl-CoA epimerase
MTVNDRIKKFDHVALVIKNTDATFKLLSTLFGFEVTESRANPEEGFKSTLISAADVTLELIEPVGPQGTMQKFVEKRGGGLHHISIQVADLEGEMKQLKSRGAQFVNPEPMQVSENTKIAFIHPRSTDGLLIELVERK